MPKNGAGYDPDIEDVPNDFGYDEDPAFVTEEDLDEEPDFEDAEGGFIDEEEL